MNDTTDNATDDTYTLLRDSARDFCAGLAQQPAGREHDTRLWKEMAQLGWMGVAIAEELGGSANGLVGAGVIASELGRVGQIRGYAETVAFAAALERAGQHTSKPVAALLRAVAQGEIQLGFMRAFTDARVAVGDAVSEASDGLMPDAGAPRVGLVMLSPSGELMLHELGTTARQTLLRTTSRAADIHLQLDAIARDAGNTRSMLAAGEQARAVWADAQMLYRLLTAAQLIAATQAALGICTDYAKVRSQFGQLIGSFQAVQHALVDILASSDAGELLVLRALAALDHGAADQQSLAAAATAFARETAWTGLMKSYDIMGGVGFVEVHPINRLTRALLPAIASIGSTSECEDAVAEHVRPGHWLAQPEARMRT